ncbi:SufS family cysteine desulfurase [Fusibacter bizertensis]|uniref:Cysteine desulfurase n=1 Tax=Fusibacter bizertensis TaxID=1488331 RepID=A0ABT6NCD0_9FIRM|nr:SufS family cysteine desulfurase [Fusibacter bizertensis]MDH8678041.1 SufS family cysteine desulfurase [Fusibacter bizertensis]
MVEPRMRQESYKSFFPIFEQHPSLIYLDHAATSQKPSMVIERMRQYLEESNGSPHRGAHLLSVEATRQYDYGRGKVAEFIGANSEREIVFTKNATEALNLIAFSYGRTFVDSGDEIVIAITSHHSNIVPWQQIAKEKGAILKYLYVDQEGDFLPGEIDKITPRTKIVAFPWISNGLGCIHDPERLTKRAHEFGAVVVLDAAQAIAHMPVDVKEMGIDFLVFSGHKMYGPTGVGVLYGKYELLEVMPPFLTGGDMIEYVEEQETTFATVPERFEAGTQHVEGVVGLVAAIDFIASIGLEEIALKEQRITKYAMKKLSELKCVQIYGPKIDKDRGALVTFNVEGIHPHDMATLLDQKGIAIRAGHHCTQPLMKYLEITASCRASFSIYNYVEEIDALVEGILYAREVFGYVNG